MKQGLLYNQRRRPLVVRSQRGGCSVPSEGWASVRRCLGDTGAVYGGEAPERLRLAPRARAGASGASSFTGTQRRRSAPRRGASARRGAASPGRRSLNGWLLNRLSHCSWRHIVSRKRSTENALEAAGSFTTRTPPSARTAEDDEELAIWSSSVRLLTPPTSDHLPSPRVALQGAQQDLGLSMQDWTTSCSTAFTGPGPKWSGRRCICFLSSAPPPAALAAAAASATAFSSAMVSLLGRRPRTPFLTGSAGSGLGSRYGDCMERRLGLEGEAGRTGTALGRLAGGGGVTGGHGDWRLYWRYMMRFSWCLQALLKSKAPRQPSNITKTSSPFTSPTVAGQMRYGFFLSTASSFMPNRKRFCGGLGGSLRTDRRSEVLRFLKNRQTVRGSAVPQRTDRRVRGSAVPQKTDRRVRGSAVPQRTDRRSEVLRFLREQTDGSEVLRFLKNRQTVRGSAVPQRTDGSTGSQTFLKAAAGAISAPFRVLRRNMGHEEAFIRKPAGGGTKR
ncbi:hypothetical protein EYF80_036216 [Liparis tanakae]|uniref:Uncharacterized protein n=1 Tax=Liparis tanakae TaxID=230148 RepID=A0A4Z2GL61_9TELE|nr:hypothetical protein EYF80_036216 [Liparis tanakae]